MQLIRSNNIHNHMNPNSLLITVNGVMNFRGNVQHSFFKTNADKFANLHKNMRAYLVLNLHTSHVKYALDLYVF